MDWSVALPVRPFGSPGAGDSPGARTSTRANGPPTTCTTDEVSGWMAASSTSAAQIRCGPERNSLAWISRCPLASVVSAGMAAKASLEPSETSGPAVGTRFQ